MRYFLLKTIVDDENYHEETYGIMMLDEKGRQNYICNVNSDCNKVKVLVEKMNESHIESCHAGDVVEDFEFENSLI